MHAQTIDESAVKPKLINWHVSIGGRICAPNESCAGWTEDITPGTHTRTNFSMQVLILPRHRTMSKTQNHKASPAALASRNLWNIIWRKRLCNTQEQLERPETRGTFSAVCAHLTHVKDYQYWSYKVLCFTVYSSPSTVAWRLAKESVAHVCTNSRDLGLGIQSMKCTLKTAVNSTNMVSISCRMLPMKYKLSAPTKCETWLIPGIKDLVDYFYQE